MKEKIDVDHKLTSYLRKKKIIEEKRFIEP